MAICSRTQRCEDLLWPLHEAANMPRHAAANSAHGIGGVPDSTTGSVFDCDDMKRA